MATKAGSLARVADASDRIETPRHATRHKIFRVVAVEVDRTCYRAHMLNVSIGGACLHARLSLRPWQTVMVDLDGHLIPSRVSWAAGDRCGVRFLEPLTEAKVDTLLAG